MIFKKSERFVPLYGFEPLFCKKTLKKFKNREKAIFMRKFSFLIEFSQFKILFYLNFKRIKGYDQEKIIDIIFRI